MKQLLLSIITLLCLISSVACTPQLNKNARSDTFNEFSPDAKFNYGVLLLQDIRLNADYSKSFPEEELLVASDAIFASPMKDLCAQDLLDVGMNLVMHGKIEIADKLLNKCISAYPDSLPFYVLLANIYLHTGKNNDAFSLMKSFIKSNPNSEYAKLELGMLYYKSHLHNEAKEMFEKVPQKFFTPLVSTGYGHILLLERKVKKANFFLFDALNKGFIPVPATVAEITASFIDAKAPKEADEYISTICQMLYDIRQTPDPVLQIMAVNAAFANGREKYAMELLKTIPMAKDPSEPMAMLQAHILNEIGFKMIERKESKQRKAKHLSMALPILQTAVRLAPENPYILDSLAWAHFKNGSTKEAFDYFTRVISMKGGDKEAEIWDHYGDVAYSLKKMDIAVDAWQKAINLKSPLSSSIKAKINKVLNATKQQK